MKKAFAVILLATASVAWGQCGQTTKAPCLVLGQRDVPAVEYTTPASYPCNVNMCSGGACLASCLTMPEVHWKCEDKSRILLTAEDGKHWCHLPETVQSISQEFVDHSIAQVQRSLSIASTAEPCLSDVDRSEEMKDAVIAGHGQGAYFEVNGCLWLPGKNPRETFGGAINEYVFADDNQGYLLCEFSADNRTFAKCEFSGTMTLEKAMWIVKDQERSSYAENSLKHEHYSVFDDVELFFSQADENWLVKNPPLSSPYKALVTLPPGAELVVRKYPEAIDKNALIAQLKRQNARLKAELAAAKKGSAKR